jgi:hypothetical protein
VLKHDEETDRNRNRVFDERARQVTAARRADQRVARMIARAGTGAGAIVERSPDTAPIANAKVRSSGHRHRLPGPKCFDHFNRREPISDMVNVKVDECS